MKKMAMLLVLLFPVLANACDYGGAAFVGRSYFAPRQRVIIQQAPVYSAPACDVDYGVQQVPVYAPAYGVDCAPRIFSQRSYLSSQRVFFVGNYGVRQRVFVNRAFIPRQRIVIGSRFGGAVINRSLFNVNINRGGLFGGGIGRGRLFRR